MTWWLWLVGTGISSVLAATLTWIAAYRLGRQAGYAEGYDRGVADGWRAANRALLLALQTVVYRIPAGCGMERIGRN